MYVIKYITVEEYIFLKSVFETKVFFYIYFVRVDSFSV